MIRRWIAVAILIGAVGACGPFCGNGKLNLSNARLNPTSFTCPVDVTDYSYSLKGSFDADNQTSKSITIKAMSTSVTVVVSARSSARHSAHPSRCPSTSWLARGSNSSTE